MLKMIEGPKVSTPYDNADGRFVFEGCGNLASHAATQWLLAYVRPDDEVNGEAWSGWHDADHIMSVFAVINEDDETHERHERQLDADDLTARGVSVLDAACNGENAQALLDLWAGDIAAGFGETWHALESEKHLDPIAAWGTASECAALAAAYNEIEGADIYTSCPMDPDDMRQHLEIILNEGINADDALRSL